MKSFLKKLFIFAISNIACYVFIIQGNKDAIQNITLLFTVATWFWIMSKE